MMTPETGRSYRRSRLHDQFGGQRQGGIATPKGFPFVFLFASSGGVHFGYQDGFQADGTYAYTGEGTRGDMKFQRGNAAIRDHEREGRRLFLFEEDGRSTVRCSGEFRYVTHRSVPQPDRTGQPRQAIIFLLERLVQGVHPSAPGTSVEVRIPHLWKLPLPDLRDLVLTSPATESDPVRRTRIIRSRSAAVAAYVRRRANGTCEGCGQPAPFVDKDGRPYLEPHHIDLLSDGGPDHPDHMAALCPNCHRAVHHAADAVARNEALRRTPRAS